MTEIVHEAYTPRLYLVSLQLLGEAELLRFLRRIYSVDTSNPVSDLTTITLQNSLLLNLSSRLLSLALPLLMPCSRLLVCNHALLRHNRGMLRLDHD